MSPLARARQVAACPIFCVFFTGLTQAADPARAPQTTGPSPAPVRPVQPLKLVPNASARIAQSALLSVDGTATGDALQLRIRRVGDKSLVSSDDVTATVDGKNEVVTRDSSGGYELPLNDLRGDGARDVELIVAHDGIREILAGKVSLADTGSAGGLLRDHKQVAWWILNIVIVLIAAIAISRRKG